MRAMYRCLLVLLAISTSLFLGLFFGLNYPEIVRHGWPRTQCTVLSSEFITRFCCETTCDKSNCRNAPSGSPQCGALVSSIDNGFSPSACAANSSACPSVIGSVCDGGSYCCNTCCSTCQSCTNSCSGNPPTCTQSCSSYSCNCYCCSQATDLYCTLSCPICYTVDLDLSYETWGGQVEDNIPYKQDFGKDKDGATAFFQGHLANSSSACYYDPKQPTEVLLNISFTVWKWAISAIFGMLPLLVILGFLTYLFMVLPISRVVRVGYVDVLRYLRERKWNWVPGVGRKGEPVAQVDDDSVPPPAYELASQETSEAQSSKKQDT